jgi:hypothetical protein
MTSLQLKTAANQKANDSVESLVDRLIARLAESEEISGSAFSNYRRILSEYFSLKLWRHRIKKSLRECGDHALHQLSPRLLFIESDIVSKKKQKDAAKQIYESEQTGH